MNNNLKIVLKVIVVVVILLNLPFQKVYSENVENIVSSLTTTDVKKQSNGKSIYIYNTHQGEKYASNSVKEGSKYLMQLLEQRGYSVDYETTDFELYKMKNHIDYAYSYTVSKKYLNNALKDHGGYDLVIDFHRDSIKKSLFFLLSQTFLSFFFEAASMTLFTLLALFGHIFIHRIQEIHFSLSVSFGLSKGIAPTGHLLAQSPHSIHLSEAFGLMGTPLYSL